MSGTKRIVMTLVAMVFVVAACGGESQQFTEDFNEAQKPLETLLADVSSSASAPDGAKMDKLADGLDDTATKISELDAPDDAKDELDAFVTQVKASADSMREVGKAVEARDTKEMTAALGELQQQMSKVSAAQQKLQTAVN
jgi:hypothetical protein